MLIDFAVTNYRSINKRQVFSMQTVSRILEKKGNIINTDKEQLLRSAVIYGRNASGKSNLLTAMDCLFKIVVLNNYPTINAYRPFKLYVDNPQTITVFEISFYSGNGKKYFYYIAFTKNKIVEENLYHYPEGKKARLFLRKNDKLTTDISDLKDIWTNIYPHHSILSRLNFHKIDLLLEPFRFFRRHFITQTSIGNEKIWQENLEMILNKSFMPSHINNLNKLLKVSDTGIDSIEIKKLKPEEFEFPIDFDDMKKRSFIEQNDFIVKLKHPVYNNGGKIKLVDFDLEEESTGTKKLLLLGSNMLDCLSDGDVLIVDELDKELHPKLMRAIINIFNNPKTNPNNAQLIFTTHDVSLLGADLFRRDQIWITEKNIEGESSYYTLADLKGIRAEVPFEKYFLKGAFGGNPVINEFDFEFNLERKDE